MKPFHLRGMFLDDSPDLLFGQFLLPLVFAAAPEKDIGMFMLFHKAMLPFLCPELIKGGKADGLFQSF